MELSSGEARSGVDAFISGRRLRAVSQVVNSAGGHGNAYSPSGIHLPPHKPDRLRYLGEIQEEALLS